MTYALIALSLVAATPAKLEAEAFEAAQLAVPSAAAEALSKVAAKSRPSGAQIGELERERAVAARDLQVTDEAYVALVGKSDPDTKKLRDELSNRRARLEAQITEIDKRVFSLDPGYSQLSRPTSLSISSVKALLNPGEVILLVLPSSEGTFTFAISKSRSSWTRSPTTLAQLEVAVRKIRTSLRDDLTNQSNTFDQEAARKLYAQLIAPVQDTLEGNSSLIIVASGPLSALPFQLLRRDGVRRSQDDVTTSQGAWLAEDYVVSTLPAVSSLRDIRCLLPKAKRRHPGCSTSDSANTGKTVGIGSELELVGFGAPILAPLEETELQLGAAERGGFDLPTFQRAFSGELADTEVLRSLPSLAGANAELDAVGRLFGPGRSAINVGSQATEERIKASSPLRDARFVVFSTHGLLSSESKEAGVSEPGLVFTPPTADARSALDDGLLTASEAASLQLSADLVVLSACNTAASDGTPGADGLSGLARAFFFAGARSLLVSHWTVSDDATSMLMESLFTQLRANPTMSPARALQSAQAKVRKISGWAGPAYWAPFAIVGPPD